MNQVEKKRILFGKTYIECPSLSTPLRVRSLIDMFAISPLNHVSRTSLKYSKK